MTHSMTGFGKVQFTIKDKSFSIEIKCLNSKQQDISVRMPSMYKSKELELRNALIKGLKRGKIELFIHVSSGSEQKTQSINPVVFKSYSEQLKNIIGEDLTSDVVASILRMPDIFSVEKEEMDEEDWSIIASNVQLAIDQVNEFRSTEGENLKKDLLTRIINIESGLEKIIERDEERIKKIKSRIQNAVADIEEKLVDKNRFEQELIYYLEKLDITEEKVRLKSHTDYFMDTISNEGEKGKKLGFISQEIGREINTIGSKANDSAMQQLVVQMKDELEKVKEQMLNIL